MYTLLIISLMLAGIILGLAFFSKQGGSTPVKFVGKIQQAATCALLLLMGIWLGGNGTFWRDIGTIGKMGALFAFVTISASVFTVRMVSRLIFKKTIADRPDKQ